MYAFLQIITPIIITVNSDLKYPGHGKKGGVTDLVSLGHGIMCQEYLPGVLFIKFFKNVILKNE